MKKNWKEQLGLCQEENLRLKLENQRIRDGNNEAIEQARRDEAVRIAGKILAERGGTT